jgi:hypothetical protein
MGGSSHVENDAIVKEQQKQATDAAAKETKRQKNITTGLANIKNAFEGKAVTKATSHKFDWKNFNDKTVLPKGYKRVQVDATGKALAGTPAQAATTGGVSFDPNAGTAGVGYNQSVATLSPGKAAVAAAPATGGTTAIMGPDGKIYKSGQAFNYTSNDPTGAVTGGYGDDFYKAFTDDYTGYYKDQVQKKFDLAQSDEAAALARAGLGVSSAANTVNADLVSQKAAQDTNVDNLATQQDQALHTKVREARKRVTDQLYQTEDPELAANTALSETRALSLATPEKSPLSQIFDIAAIGGANLLKNYNNQASYNQFQMGLPKSSGHINN